MTKTLIAAAALLTATAVLAQTPPPAPVAPPAPPAPMAHPMHDKVMTRAETIAMVREHFGKMDADRNGTITTAELEQMRTKLAGDGKVHRFEHRIDGPGRDPNAAFDRLDSNKDGSISREEFTQAREERIERRIVRREEIKKGAPKEGRDVRRFVMRHHGGFGGRMIVMADTNSDGQVTLAEAETMALQHFDRMDANKDGQVTREERRAGRPALIKRMREEKKDGS
ncbi:MAG TPA: EF-hand domain-containing protein [Reyranellaceae bacterium]|nr:EF-hand domain-containing protein [Reyranellaceae bacterium]